MALINCPECEKEVSDKAKVCQHCGYPFSEIDENIPQKVEVTAVKLNTKKSKKIIVGIIIAILICIGAAIAVKVNCTGSKKIYTIKKERVINGSELYKAKVTLKDNIDDSPVYDEEYLETFFNMIWKDLRVSNGVKDVSVTIYDKSETYIGFILFVKEDKSVRYMFDAEGTVGLISGDIKE